jgi:hypothetical protein
MVNSKGTLQFTKKFHKSPNGLQIGRRTVVILPHGMESNCLVSRNVGLGFCGHRHQNTPEKRQ